MSQPPTKPEEKPKPKPELVYVKDKVRAAIRASSKRRFIRVKSVLP